MTKILHQAFNSAKMNLEYALHASGQNQIEYIRQARIEFNQAVSVEEFALFIYLEIEALKFVNT